MIRTHRMPSLPSSGPAAEPIRREAETLTLGLSFALGGCLLGIAAEMTHGLYDLSALRLLSAAILVCIVGIVGPEIPRIQSLSPRAVMIGLAAGIVLQVIVILKHNDLFLAVNSGTVVIGSLALTQLWRRRTLRWPLLALVLIAFVIVAVRAIKLNWPDPNIDVFMFQQMTAKGLLDGANPYAMRFPSLYPYGTPFYGRGVVDSNNQLTFGFPYPPLSLLMVLPAYVLGGECRYADVVAIAGTAGLMAAARPGRWSALVACMFLLTPLVFFVVERSWTEPLLALTFSLVMFCAVRWRRGLPWALGLFFATKQYTVLAVPLVWLLLDEPGDWRSFFVVLIKAFAVAGAITLPFLLWDPREFFRAVVQYQFLQPFRRDSLSYLVWIRTQYPRFRVQWWTPLMVVLPAIAFVLRRCPRSPSGFAAAVTVVYLLFFAFNKQAFANYYYFAIATAFWAAASNRLSIVLDPTPDAELSCIPHVT